MSSRMNKSTLEFVIDGVVDYKPYNSANFDCGVCGTNISVKIPRLFIHPISVTCPECLSSWQIGKE